jgi:hypothetical protein
MSLRGREGEEIMGLRLAARSILVTGALLALVGAAVFTGLTPGVKR